MQHSFLFVLLYSISAFAQLKLEYKITYTGTPGSVDVIVFAADGKHFYSGDNRGYVLEWEVGKDSPKNQFKSLFGGINSLTLNQQGSMIASTAADGSIYVWNLKTNENPRRMRAPVNPEIPLSQQFFTAFSPDGKYIYFGGRNRYLSKAAIDSKEKPKVIYLNTDWDFKAGVFSPGGELVVAMGDKLVFLRDDQVERELVCADCIVNALKFDKTGQYILTWCEDGRTRVWDAKTGVLQFSRDVGKAGPDITNLDFSVEDKYQVKGVGGFATWDVNHQGFKIDASKSEINFVFPNEDERWLASSDGKNDIQLWKIVDPSQKEKTKVVAQVEPEKMDVNKVLKAEKKLDPKPEETIVVADEPKPKPINDIPKPEPKTKPEPKPEIAVTPMDTAPKEYQLPQKFQGRRVLPIATDNKLAFTEPNLNITVWDNTIMDGDIISLYLNDSLVLNQYTLDTIPKTIPVYIEKGKKTYLTLHAHNLGTVPPNTADIIVSDGKKEYQIILKSDFQGSSVAEIKVD